MHYLSLNRENVLVRNLEEQLINHTVAYSAHTWIGDGCDHFNFAMACQIKTKPCMKIKIRI